MDYNFSQVSHNNNNHTYQDTQIAGLRSIQPVAAQILSAADSDGRPIHIELDSATTVSYITLAEATKRRYHIKPNNQVSHLGDGLTPLKSCGEIDVTIYRNDHPLRFRALVTRHLHCPAIGGTTFLQDNNIKQDFSNNIIHLLGNTCIVPSTRREALLPVLQMSATTCLHCIDLQAHTTQTTLDVQYGFN